MNSILLAWEEADGSRFLEVSGSEAYRIISENHKSIASRFETSISGQSLLRLRPKVLGGKGGFGRLLRNQKNLGKKTDNFDSCRDLDGRRVRSVKRDEKIEELEKKKDSKTTDNKSEVAPAPAKGHVALDESYIKQLAHIRVEKEKSVLEGLRATSEALAKLEQPPVKKMKTIAIFDDEDSSD